jgi:Carboxypeptidase regulatory-like domain
MRFGTSMRVFALLATIALLLSSVHLFSQETTGGLQGTIKDASGAVVPGAHVMITGTTLVGNKALDTDSSGYYRFANLPPGFYTITVTSKNFKTEKREGVNIEIGHLPTLDLTLQVGTNAEVVEVTGAAPLIDTTTNSAQTNVTKDVIDNIPHGNSFQSMIQFSPMARNEPLAGGTAGMTGNSGGSMPGSSGNGQAYGYSIGGAADSESAYLVEGQDTENISGGFSQANVPFQFIQEVQIKTSGIEAEHGGALGGVVNVVMKKGSNGYHGEFFTTYELSDVDGSPNAFLRYNPTPGNIPAGFDNNGQEYQAQKDHFRFIQPGVTVGGPVLKDRLWFFAGFAPYVTSRARNVNFAPSQIASNAVLGNQYFTQDTTTYYSTFRLDATVTQKIRIFGSWLNQYARQTGSNMPQADSAFAGYYNQFINTPIVAYSHGIGWSNPNATYNVGADISLTPKIVATTRYGYFFTNYHDFGWQTTQPNIVWSSNGVNVCDNTIAASVTTTCLPGTPGALPASLQLSQGSTTAPYNGSYTQYNASKHYQFDQDIAFFKSGWWGTHNIKGGYQLNHLVNVINQNGNVPEVFLNLGNTHSWFPFTSTGNANCGYTAPGLSQVWSNCAGQYGYAYVQDFATILPQPAADWNHALFIQDAWTVGRGLTLNLGLRVEKEHLPTPTGIPVRSIDFSWSDKIEPRLGAAWGSRDGKIKVFGSYGVVNDVMKLLLAQTSWGAQSFEQCSYALGPDSSGTFNVNDINPIFVNNRACPNGLPTVGANWATGAPPASLVDKPTGISLIENVNLRPWEPVAPNVKPYRQHEYVAGGDYQLSRDFAVEVRYDRRRLDHILEDSSLADPFWGETYTVVNPGEGVNKTIDGYASFLTSLGESFGVPNWAFNGPLDQAFGLSFGTCPTCPPMPKAIRNYDGLELRLTKAPSKGWAGMFSYTWSSLWGNYNGLTNTDQIDGGFPGRNSPDTSRAFDEPFYYYGANGKSTDGPLPTDRPNTFKGYAYYHLPWKGMNTTFGLFQTAYQGSPQSSFIDVAGMFPNQVSEAVYVYGRGKWVNTTQDATGNITIGNPYSRRAPWFTQTDFNFGHEIKVNKNNEHQLLGFQMNITNLLNQRAVTSIYGGMNSTYLTTPLSLPGVNLSSGAALYQATMSGYNVQALINGTPTTPRTIQSGQYGLPFTYQLARGIRFMVDYTF